MPPGLPWQLPPAVPSAERAFQKVTLGRGGADLVPVGLGARALVAMRAPSFTLGAVTKRGARLGTRSFEGEPRQRAPSTQNTVHPLLAPPGLYPKLWREDRRGQEWQPETLRSCLRTAAESLGALGQALLLPGPQFSASVS